MTIQDLKPGMKVMFFNYDFSAEARRKPQQYPATVVRINRVKATIKTKCGKTKVVDPENLEREP